jgi:hypothetical protein
MTWSKYLPVIKILLKIYISADQSLAMNSIDFQKGNVAKKTGYSFSFDTIGGRIRNSTKNNVPAKDLAETLLQDSTVKELLSREDFHLSMDSKFNLSIKSLPKEVEVSAEMAEASGQ